MSADRLEPYRKYADEVHRAVWQRWPQTLQDVGIGAEFLKNRHGPCPGCGGTDRFRFDDKEGRGSFLCGGGGERIAGDGFALVMHFLGCDFPTAQRRVGDVFGIRHPDDGEESEDAAKTAPEPLAKLPVLAPRATEQPKRETLSDWGHGLWRSCSHVEGTAGESYLRARACVIPPADGDLRFHPHLKHHQSGHVGPALVALVTNARTNAPQSLHRTWIRPDGTKAIGDDSRTYLKGHTTKGGVIRLWPDDAVQRGLAICEGIESALSIAHAFQPTWAVLDAGTLAGLPVLDGIEALTIGADNDAAGVRSAETCAERWSVAGREARIVIGTEHKQDLNDIARRAA